MGMRRAGYSTYGSNLNSEKAQGDFFKNQQNLGTDQPENPQTPETFLRQSLRGALILPGGEAAVRREYKGFTDSTRKVTFVH